MDRSPVLWRENHSQQGLPTRRLLIVEDDPGVCSLLRRTFKGEDLELWIEQDGAAGLQRALNDRPDVMVLDVTLPRVDGLAVLEKVKAAHPTLPVIMLTGAHEVGTVVRATRLGAFDYLTKPFDPETVAFAVRRALETQALRTEVEELRQRVELDEAGGLLEAMGSSSHVQSIVKQVTVVAASDYSVLVLGETGTGKELVATAVHRQSARRGKPFIALDCGAIPEPLLESELFGHERGAFTGADRRRTGQFVLAAGGTCFLDEISNMPMSLQAKLLRVLESKQVQPVGAERSMRADIRFVAATNADLQRQVTEGRFRADLYFRLAQYTILLPPLRARREDIDHLAIRFAHEASIELRRPVQALTPEALAVLRDQPWPGNVRQLRNVVRSAVLRCTGLEISPSELRAALDSAPDASATIVSPADGRSLKIIADDAAHAAERQAISQVLTQTGGNKAAAARILQTDYKTLHLKMKAYGLHAGDFVER